LLPPTGVAAQFDDATLQVGQVRCRGRRNGCASSTGMTSRARLSVRLPGAATVTDYWYRGSLGRREGVLSIPMTPRSARLLKVLS